MSYAKISSSVPLLASACPPQLARIVTGTYSSFAPATYTGYLHEINYTFLYCGVSSYVLESAPEGVVIDQATVDKLTESLFFVAEQEEFAPRWHVELRDHTFNYNDNYGPFEQFFHDHKLTGAAEPLAYLKGKYPDAYAKAIDHAIKASEDFHNSLPESMDKVCDVGLDTQDFCPSTPGAYLDIVDYIAETLQQTPIALAWEIALQA